MDNDYEKKFMELVERLREVGFSQQEAIEEARERLSKEMATGGRVGLADGAMMASAPDPMDERNSMMETIAMQEFGKPLSDLTEDEIIQIEIFMEEMDTYGSSSIIDKYKRYIQEMINTGNEPLDFEEFKKMIEESEKTMAKPLPSDPTKPINPFQPKPTGPVLPDRQMAQAGGRVGYQTGGVTESRTLPPEYVEALGKTYAADLTRQAGMPTVTNATAQQPGETAQQFAQRQAQAQQFGITQAGMAELAPQVASQDPLQAAAYAQAIDPTKGLGSYQPYLTAAGQAATGATALTGTGAGTGAGSIQSYMSPYQQQVIDTTMADYDAQAAKSRLGLGAQAVSGGAFGSGRHGIAEAEFDALSNRGRSSQLANLNQSGFQNASSRRQQDLSNQMGIANLQQGLGGAAQDFSRAQISGLGTLGSAQQAQSQAVLDAQRQAAQMAVQDPQRRLNMLGSGVMGLMGGMGAGRTEIGEAPAQAQSSPLMSALGVGLAGADIYGRIFGNKG